MENFDLDFLENTIVKFRNMIGFTIRYINHILFRNINSIYDLPSQIHKTNSIHKRVWFCKF